MNRYPVREWYKDRDFPEIKAGRSNDSSEILASFECHDSDEVIARIIGEHNGAVVQIMDRDEDIAKLRVALLKLDHALLEKEKEVLHLKNEVERTYHRARISAFREAVTIVRPTGSTGGANVQTDQARSQRMALAKEFKRLADEEETYLPVGVT